jgi:hypothetical protein
MRISDPNGEPLSGLGRSSEVGPAGERVRSTRSAGPPLASDQVRLSNLSAHLTAALDDSAAHLTKLSSLTAAVLSGGYQVDAPVVSDSIIRHSLQFGGANYL